MMMLSPRLLSRTTNLSLRRSFVPSSSWPAAAGSTSSKRLFSSSSSDDESSSDSSSDSSPPEAPVTAMVPSRFGSGGEPPKTPHTLVLPMTGRPLFPGVMTTLTLTDPSTTEALEALQRQQDNHRHPNHPHNQNQPQQYVSVFLRKDHPTGVSEGGVLLPTPEVITDPSQLYSVGTFAQIYRITRASMAQPQPHNKHGAPSSSSSSKPFASQQDNPQDGEYDHHENNNNNNNGHDDDEDGGGLPATILLMGHRRVDLLSVDEIGPPIEATVGHWPRLDYTGVGTGTVKDDTIRALSNEVLTTIRDVAQINPLFRENVQYFAMRLDANDPYRLADFAAGVCSTGSPQDLQAVLEEKDAEMRLHKALVLLNKERQVSKLQQEISAKVEEKMSEQQRKYFLTEQLKSIKKELGMERDDKEALVQKYREQLAKYSEIPEDAMSVIEQELEKLSTLEMNSSEYNVTRNYLDWLVGVPWGVVSDENFDILKARKILDRDHYGLDDVKDTILEFIAVGKLKGSVQGKILCLAGPPGTGKTSIAKSVADSLGRQFFRFSVGGLSGTSEITGHRRTYVGAMPGKIIQCLKTVSVVNPVILIDEIDKLGQSYQGDPASALLEVLDPSQNSTFRDHYLDVPVDISKVLFMCTANDLDRIPGPLLDRMEVVRLSGYDFPEKVAIAEQYLLPKSMKDNGLMVEKEEESSDTPESTPEAAVEKTTPKDSFIPRANVPEGVGITTDAIESLVRWYCREAGVRNLSKHIDKITRKLALQVVAEEEGAELTEKSTRKHATWTVSEDNLSDYVGKQIFTSDRLYDKDPLPNGIVMGLAYTSMGGSALYIETTGIKRGIDPEGKTRGGGGLKVTGKLGDVMKESSEIAYTVARGILADIDSSNQYFDVTDIHMHVPEGATPKDGPSAGIAMVTSMLSLALGKPIRNDTAMTGEVTLTGKVLPVGGIKEKIMGGRRAGVKTIVLPHANQRDYEEIPDYLKEGLTVHFAEEYQEVYDVVFGTDK